MTKELDSFVETQKKLIHVFLFNPDLIKKHSKYLNSELFDLDHKKTVSYLRYCMTSDSVPSVDGFEAFLDDHFNLEKVQKKSELTAFNSCLVSITEAERINSLLSDLKKNHLRRRSSQAISDYAESRKSKGDISANSELIDKLTRINSSIEDSVVEIKDLSRSGEEWIANLIDRRDNPKVRLLSGFREIDHTMSVGFQPGHLTMFVAPPANAKTGIMINIAANIFELYKENVLYVPLEMNTKEIMDRLVSRKSQVHLGKISNPAGGESEAITEDEILRIKKVWEEWQDEKFTQKFQLMKPGDQIKVSVLRNEIKQRISWFQPKVVFIDYVDGLESDKKYHRGDEEKGSILNSLRNMGAEMGFHIVTAAQMGRDAIRRLREQSEDNSEGMDSTDIRGGQVYAANSDQVYGQIKNRQSPDNLLDLFCIKSRHGPQSFPGGGMKTSLLIDLSRSIIRSQPRSEEIGWDESGEVEKLMTRPEEDFLDDLPESESETPF